MDVLRYPEKDYVQKLHVLFDKKYADLKFDLIIAIDPASLDFAIETRERLSLTTPVIFGVSEADIPAINLLTNVTGVVLKEKKSIYLMTLELALRLHPDTRRVVLVGGIDEMSQKRLEKAKAALASYGSRLEFTWLTNMTMDTILSKLIQLPEDTIVFYVFLLRDSSGKNFVPKEAGKLVAQASNRPVYGFWDLLIGTGIVGGHMASSRVLGTKVAELGLRVLMNENPGDIPIIEGENEYIFDWNQLQRWNITEGDLPPGSRVEFKAINFFEIYKWYIFSGIALCIIEAVLIFFLVINRTKRLKVERELRNHRDHLEELVHERTVEIKNAHQELTESEERFRSLSDAAFEGILITEKGKILEANSTMAKMFGRQTADLVGMDSTSLVPKDVRKDAKDKILSGYEKPYETVGIKKDGTKFPIEIHAKMFTYKGRQVRVAAIRDLTEQKKAEEEIKILRGILPLCSFCIKIRDDKGYWEQVDIYIHKYSEADISHSICPDCTKKHYPRAYESIYSDKNKK